MRNLLKAFFFKLSKDLTFRITAIVGIGLTVLLSTIYILIDRMMVPPIHLYATGQSMLVGSISPTQNFGIAIPVNLISFTVLEFSQGTIRNKIIAGNSKSKVYITLFISGLIFTLLLLFSYIGLNVAIGSIAGGFDANGTIANVGLLGSGKGSPEFFVKLMVLTVLVYTFITAFTLFFATLFRNVGPCIPIVIVFLMMCYFGAAILSLISEDAENVMKFINPLYGISCPHVSMEPVGEHSYISYVAIENDAFIASIVMNLVYSAIFFFGGLLIFKKRDVK